VASGLALAATFDPEPISKTILAIGAALTGVITKMLAGCGQSCIDASNYVNEAEQYFVQNVAAYTSSPVRTQSMQTQALANFDTAYAALVAKCQQIGGQGGVNCIKDRQSGACKWKASPWTWAQTSGGGYAYTPAGAAGSGSQCWNWVYGYRDPIANDPDVVPDASTLTSATSSVSSALSSLLGGVGGGSSSASPLILVGLGLAAIYLISD
jgi:hypothetical protein